jgi:biotin transport system substrate-specific component
VEVCENSCQALEGLCGIVLELSQHIIHVLRGGRPVGIGLDHCPVDDLLCLLLGAAGMPVFSGFQGGIGCLAGVTGGYLWGFAFSGLIYWLLERFGKLPAMIAAQLTCYLFGSFWFYLYAGGGLWLIIARCVLPFLLPDAIKIALACTLTRRLARHIT